VPRNALADLDHEVKFVLPAGRAAMVASFLHTVCTADPKHPRGRIASLYYDTLDLSLLADKVDSQYLKTKVRVRWYEESRSGEPQGLAFAEIKYRIGSRREKVHREIPVEAAWLARQPLESGAVAVLPDHLGLHGHRLPRPLVAALVVRYHRERFVEHHSGARVALDTSIAPGAAHPRILRGGYRRPLGVAVLEVKSTDRRLPALLRPLVALGCRQTSFSKYGACMIEAGAEAA
jgi:hypothetical protein